MSVDRLKRDAIDAAQKYKARYKQSLDPNDLDMFKRFMDVYNHLSDIGAGGGSQNLQEVTDVGNTTTNTIETAGTKSDYFLLDTLATPTPQQGMLFWDEDRSTVGLQLNGVEARLGQDNFWYVKNQTGSPIPKGTAVMAVGALGASSRILVAPMIADGSVEAKYFLGITAEEILDGEDGFVTNIGKIRGIDTSVYGTQAGQILYCDPANPGGLTITQPAAPNLDIAAAFTVDYKSNGTLAVRALPGYELNELHDVYINTPSTGQLLRYNTNRWENWTPNFLTTVPTLDQVTTSGNTTTNTVSVGKLFVNTTTDAGYKLDVNGTARVSGDFTVDTNTLFVNATNNRVGIGTVSPSYPLDVNGVLRSTSAIYLANSTWYGSSIHTNQYQTYLTFTGGSFTFKHADSVGQYTERNYLTVRSTGRVAINSQVADATLHVHGDARVNTSTYLAINSGNVGIGTTTPSEKLEVAGDIAIRDTIGALNFIYSSTPTRIARLDSDNGNLRIKADINGAQASSFISFDIDNSEKSRINSNGNLLIGTTVDTGYKLEVNGNVKVSGTIEAVGGTSSDWNQAYLWGDHSTAGYLQSGVGWNGTIMIPVNPPGMQNIDVVDGLIMNVF